MTPQERAAFDALVIAWNAFAALPTEHGDDTTEFRTGIHVLQRQILARPARRGINGCVQPIASAPKAAPPPKPLR